MRMRRAAWCASAASRLSKIARTCAEASPYSGLGRSEMGSPAAMRRAAKVGMKLQCARPRAIVSICTTAVGRVCARTHASASCCRGVTVSVQGNPGPAPRLPMSDAL